MLGPSLSSRRSDVVAVGCSSRPGVVVVHSTGACGVCAAAPVQRHNSSSSDVAVVDSTSACRFAGAAEIVLVIDALLLVILVIDALLWLTITIRCTNTIRCTAATAVHLLLRN